MHLPIVKTPMSETPQKKNGSDMTRDPCFRLQHASRISKKQTAKYFVGKIFEKCIFLNMVIVVVIEICHLWHHCLFPLLLDKKVMQTSKNISTLEREFDLQQYGTNRKHLAWFVQKLCWDQVDQSKGYFTILLIFVIQIIKQVVSIRMTKIFQNMSSLKRKLNLQQYGTNHEHQFWFV